MLLFDLPEFCFLDLPTAFFFMPTFQSVCRFDEMDDGQSQMIRLGEASIALFRVGEDYFAMQNECPHAGASLARGYLENDVVRCRIHHWGFCVRSGQYIDENRPAMNARVHEVRIVDGWVEVALEGRSNDQLG